MNPILVLPEVCLVLLGQFSFLNVCPATPTLVVLPTQPSSTIDINVANWQVYEDTTYGFSFKYPPKYKLDQATKQDIYFRKTTTEYIQLEILTYHQAPAIIDALKQTLSQRTEEVSVISGLPMIINFTYNGAAQRLSKTAEFMINDNYLKVSSPTTANKHIAIFDALIESFKAQPPPPPGPVNQSNQVNCAKEPNYPGSRLIRPECRPPGAEDDPTPGGDDPNKFNCSDTPYFPATSIRRPECP